MLKATRGSRILLVKSNRSSAINLVKTTKKTLAARIDDLEDETSSPWIKDEMPPPPPPSQLRSLFTRTKPPVPLPAVPPTALDAQKGADIEAEAALPLAPNMTAHVDPTWKRNIINGRAILKQSEGLSPEQHGGLMYPPDAQKENVF